MVPGTQKHSAAAKGKARAAFKAMHIAGGMGPCMVLPLLSVCTDGTSHSPAAHASDIIAVPGPRGPQVPRSSLSQLLTPNGQCQRPVPQSRALTPCCAPVFCLVSLGVSSGPRRLEAKARGGGRTLAWDVSCSHFTRKSAALRKNITLYFCCTSEGNFAS